MLRSAWTGGKNYHLDSQSDNRRFDAFRVRYPSHKGELTEAIKDALWSQEMLVALRAYDRNRSLLDAINDWHATAAESLTHLEAHLKDQRWDDHYGQWRIADMTVAFKENYEYGSKLKANFSERFRKRIIKLLRQDNPDDPIPFEEYTALIEEAQACLESFPRTTDEIELQLKTGAEQGSFSTIWPVVEAYTEWTSDEQHRDGYRKLLRDRPWEECDCPVCTDLGIEVAIFRGNNRNRRRGFHNTRRFYDQFERDLPKLLLLTKGDSSLTSVSIVEEFLAEKRDAFWSQVHDLPVAEIGAVTAKGVHEWWDTPPSALSSPTTQFKDVLEDRCARYQAVYIDGQNWDLTEDIRDTIEEVDCEVHLFEKPSELREAVLERIGYDERTIPPHPERLEVNQFGISEF